MERLKIIEAMAHCTKLTGINLTQKELAKNIEVWKNSPESSRATNMSALIKGNRMQKFVSIILDICKKTGVDPNFLFDYTKLESVE